MKKIIPGLLTGIFMTTAAVAQQTDPSKAAYELIKRVLPDAAASFEVAFIPKSNDKDVFELESKGGKIVLRGNTAVSIGSALNYYLQHYAHCDISWNGSNLHLPSPLPAVTQKIRKETPYRYRYYLNYCTFNYSMSWWNWDRWQWEIDWMALNGINMPLALTGQNTIWKKVYNSLGFSDKDLETFFSGPAYFNWFWMGNLDGWGGPLPQSWLLQHEALQKKILERERSLGMTPILPAFTGHVPPAFGQKFPQAKLKKTNWSDFPAVYILDPADSMFTVIGQRFAQEQMATYGTDHFYSSDTFNENLPPTNDSTFLNDVSRKVYQSMAAVDPKAVWVMQGWMFSFQSKFWQPTQIKALLNAVPDDHMLILDLYSENKPMWNKTEAYYGKPWIWCMLHNFGGNISLWGRMDHVANDPVNAHHSPDAGKMEGIGLTPEAIEQNPALYELMLEHVWNDKNIDLESWLKDYAHRRYGAQNEDAEKAWMILKNTVYNGGITEGGPESIIVSRPTFAASTKWANTKKSYRPADIIPAWRHFIKAAPLLKGSEGFQYDIVDLTRQVLVNYADTLQRGLAKTYQSGDAQAFRTKSVAFITLIEDIDRLLATRKDFLLGRWLNMAKACGTTPGEKALYERNARNLITLWGGKNARLHEYSCRQWSGMLNGFYRPRWQAFFNEVQQSMQEKKPVDEKAFEERIKDWEWNWVNGHEPYTDQPKGDAVATAQEMFGKYAKAINEIYGLK